MSLSQPVASQPIVEQEARDKVRSSMFDVPEAASLQGDVMAWRPLN